VNSLFEELKRRNVVRVGVAYVLLLWVAIQVTETVGPVLRLPEWTLAFVTWIGIIGLPVVLIFSWVFELTPEGLKREADVDRSASITPDTGRKLNYVVIGLLVVAVVVLLIDRGGETTASDPAATPVAGEVTATESGYDSIGVLPFVNMSDDASQEYFSDGISEELLNALAKLRGLQVAARTSSFAFKGQNQDIIEIGRKLNVDTVLEGSVRKAGNRLRITAQLIDVDNGFHLWSETYDRELTDVFAVQDEITAAIVDALLLHFDAGEVLQTGGTEVTNMSAYDAYLQGRHKMREVGSESTREALSLFRAATEADPEFAPAWAARAVAVIELREDHFREGIPREESHMLARNNIERALEIDPNLAEAYVAKSYLEADEYRYEDALASLEKALGFNPNLADAWIWHARLVSRFGHIRKARENILKALDLDPHNPQPVITAANLLQDFYDPGFLGEIEPRAAQVPRARKIVESARIPHEESLTRETYERVLANPMFPAWEAVVNFWMLKEIDVASMRTQTRNANDFLMWVYMSLDSTWDKAQAMYDALPPERQRSVLNLEELSVMQVARGECEAALETLRRAHGDEIRVYGELGPNQSRSNANLALNRVYCLRRLGRSEEADAIHARVRDYVDTLRANTVYGIYVVDAKLRILDGDIGGALDTLEAAADRNEVGWIERYQPIVRDLSGEPRFTQLFNGIDEQIDALRAELGMPLAKDL
jgi:TolB-like protein